MTASATPRKSAAHASASAASAFRHKAFAIIWIATVISNIGTWMYNLASGWLMLGLNADPFIVSLVQVANSLPMFLFAIPAGALVDIVDRRRFLIVGESGTTLVALLFAALVWQHLVTPTSLLVFSFIVTVGSAITAPAWQAVVPQLVTREDLPSAVAANSAGINVSRAIGPALGGALVNGFGIAAPFWVDALSNLGVIGALIWWRPPPKFSSGLPPESIGGAIRTGIRHARYNNHLRGTLLRAVAFFIFGSGYWALLPLVVHSRTGGGAGLYGILLGCIGFSAVCGAFSLPRLRRHWNADRLLVGGTLATSIATGLFAIAQQAWMAVLASVIAGLAWIVSLSSLNISAQTSLPDWVRGRGLAVYVTAMFGALTLGSALWGEVAARMSLPLALLLCAAGGILVIPLTSRWKLQTGAHVDFSPSLHWPAPVVVRHVDADRGPVMVTVEYRIDPANRLPFLKALGIYGRERRRDGAYDWGVYEDPAQPGRFVETFRTDSWLEHLRHHQRVTRADRVLESEVRRFQLGGDPKTTHLIDARIEE